jgi:hypothetical protein
LNAVEKYLARHAEPEAAAAAGLEGVFGHALEIPAYGEGDALFETLASVPAGPGGDVLIVLVLNARADSPAAVHEANARVRARLDATAPSRKAALSGDPAISVRLLPRGTLVVIDRALPGRYLPEGQGVGLARKIGCDFILRLRSSDRLRSPWIHCTDADVRLPGDYFEQLSGDRTGPSAAAALYFFEHDVEPDEGLARAARLYEISLRYYVLGLAWAGSPYAYQSMGSCLAVRDASYAAVRGFPRRNALEDFYVLNKLAKVGTIVRLGGAPLRLKGRVSDRVPISTGRALGEMVAAGPGARRRSLLYHPAVFAHLAAWLRVLLALTRSGGKLEEAFGMIPRDNPFFRADLLEEALRKLGAFEAVREALAVGDDPVTLGRRLHAWFDAFRTLKLIHALRDAGLPSLHWSAALAEAPFTGLSAATEESAEDLGRALAREERKLAGRPAGLDTGEAVDA